MLAEILFLHGDIWPIRDGETVIGYALAQISGELMTMFDLLLAPGMNSAEAVASIIREVEVQFVRIRIEHLSIEESLVLAGYEPALPQYGSFMIKAVTLDVTVPDAVRLLGIGSERFMISTMDTT